MKNLSPFISSGLLDEIFKDISSGYFIKPLHGDALPAQIKIDLKENANEFTVHAEIPGAGRDDIDVNIDGNSIYICAQIYQIDSESADDKLLQSERYYGSVSRSFQLPVDIDEATSKANYKNGVLTLNLVKKQKKEGTRLSID